MPPKNIIISCAITGSLHTPSMSPYLPITPEQIAAESIAAAEAGAAIIHLHARNPEDGKPTSDPEVFKQFLPVIKSETNAVLNMTTGGAPGMNIDQRLEGPEYFQPEMCSLNMGSMNTGLFAAMDRMTEFIHEWEPAFLSGTKNAVFENTFGAIETIITRMGQKHGARFEFECYDISHLNNLHYIVKKGLYDGPLYIQFVMGVLGGIPAEVDNLLAMVRTAQKLFGDDVELSVIGAGRAQFPMSTHHALMGGNVRVGLEDNVYLNAGEFAKSNADQVHKIKRIVTELGFGIATPDEARERLGLKGATEVNF